MRVFVMQAFCFPLADAAPTVVDGGPHGGENGEAKAEKNQVNKKGWGPLTQPCASRRLTAATDAAALINISA